MPLISGQRFPPSTTTLELCCDDMDVSCSISLCVTVALPILCHLYGKLRSERLTWRFLWVQTADSMSLWSPSSCIWPMMIKIKQGHEVNPWKALRIQCDCTVTAACGNQCRNSKAWEWGERNDREREKKLKVMEKWESVGKGRSESNMFTLSGYASQLMCC